MIKKTVDAEDVHIVISPSRPGDRGQIAVTLVYDDGNNPHYEISRCAFGATVEGALLSLVEHLAIELYANWNRTGT